MCIRDRFGPISGEIVDQFGLGNTDALLAPVLFSFQAKQRLRVCSPCERRMLRIRLATWLFTGLVTMV